MSLEQVTKPEKLEGGRLANMLAALKWLPVSISRREAAFSVSPAEGGSVIPLRMVFPSHPLCEAWTQEPSRAEQHPTAAHVQIHVLYKRLIPVSCLRTLDLTF